MKLSDDALLALKAMRWALANGWRVQGRDMTIDGYTRWTAWEHDDKADVTLTYYRHDGHMQYDLCDVPLLSVREAVDVLVALGLLPIEFSSAWAAGRESAYTTDEWRAVFDAVDGPRAWHEPVNDRAVADAVLTDCRKYYTDAYLQHRRAGGTDWEKVATDV